MNINDVIKIALVGEYSIFRSSLRMLLEAEKRNNVVGEVSNISEIFNLPARQKPDLILIDLPEKEDKSNLFPFLSQSTDKTPVLVLTGSNNLRIYQKCLLSGISGLVLKDQGIAILRKAIEKVYEGEFWFERIMMLKTIRQLLDNKILLHEYPKSTAHYGLTERENQTINLICKGMKNKEIANKLFITETTVRHHLGSIFQKLGVTSRLELIIYAFKHNMVKLPAQSAIEIDKGD